MLDVSGGGGGGSGSEASLRQDTRRKCILLKSLKISLESLMFERSAGGGGGGWSIGGGGGGGGMSGRGAAVTVSGTLTMFCRHLVECLLDGAVGGAHVFWSLLVKLLEDDPVFRSVRDQATTTTQTPPDSPGVLLTHWVLYSLRQHCLLAQLESLLLEPARRHLLAAHFAPTAFLLDPTFVHDFLLYIK